MTQPERRGGPRTPRNPAPVSPPGRLSRRTDGGPAQRTQDLPNPSYGEQKTFREDQQGAPMAASAGAEGAEGPPVSPVDLSGVTPLNAPSQRPGEAVTAGAAAGQGPGMEVLGQQAQDKDLATMRTYLPGMELMASMHDAPPAFRDFVRRARALA